MSSLPEDDKKRTLKINQLREITGENNPAILNEAYVKCDGNIERAIQYIADYEQESNDKMPDLTGRSLSRHKAPCIPTMPQTLINGGTPNGQIDSSHRETSIGSGFQLERSVIDLTENMNEEAELKRAIKLSMECDRSQPDNVSVEEPAKNDKASSVAPSLMSNALNPNLRRRKAPEWPAGLKNVGNTCWFSAVIQSLFNLPVFRNLILHYKSPSKLPPEESDARRNICFMQELKYLFALMIGSRQSFVDPTKCVSLLQKGFEHSRPIECQQQDVSEFTHKLLDWLEDALTHQFEDSYNQEAGSSDSSMETDSLEPSATSLVNCRNPMIDLFYGEYKAHGINNGNSFTKPEKFGLFPLYVDGVNHLHDSLELTTRDRMFQENKAGVGQELWFTSLPPVLIFELSRFHYNQKSGATEKINSSLEFPHILYMDRYMEENLERTRQCREECADLITRLQNLKAEVKARRKITIDERSYSTTDVLRCCTKFAALRRKRYLEEERKQAAIEGASPSKKMCGLQDNSMDSGLAMNWEEGDGPTPHKPATTVEKEITSAAFVEQCLNDWLKEVELEKEGLRDDIADLEKRLDTMYDDPLLKKCPYALHAVLVHQGHAISGHYWAYVKDHNRSTWLKFNDTNVTESNWTELITDSVGGITGNTSAYCLMYIDRGREELLMGMSNGEKVLSSETELQELIEKHNADYTNEIEEWDIQQAKLLSLSLCGVTSQPNTQAEETSKPIHPTTPEKEKLQVAADGKKVTEAHQSKRERKDSLSRHTSSCRKAIYDAQTLYQTLGAEGTTDHEILNLTMQASMLAIARSTNAFNLNGPESALLEVVKEEWQRLKILAEDPADATSDTRLQHIAVYMFKNRAPRKIIERAVLEQFADDRISYDHQSAEIMKCAKDKLKNLTPEDLNNDEFQKWQRDYRFFCKATCYLIHGLELCQNNKHAEALPYLANVKKENDRLSATAEGGETTKLVADWELANRTAGVCIQNLHNLAMEKFRSKDDKIATEGLNLLVESVVPWIHLLPLEMGANAEPPLIETIRSDWCSFCNETITDERRKNLEAALQALLDPPTQPETQAAFHTPALIRPQNPQDLCERFQNAMSTMITANNAVQLETRSVSA